MSTPVRVRPSPATSNFSNVCGWDPEAGLAGRGLHPSPAPGAAVSGRADPLGRALGAAVSSRAAPAYHDGVAGPRGQEDVIGVGGNASIAPLNVPRHVLADQLGARADAVGPWARGQGGRGGSGGGTGEVPLHPSRGDPPLPAGRSPRLLGQPPPAPVPAPPWGLGRFWHSPRLWPPHACKMRSALLLASSGKSGLFRRSGWTQSARTWEERVLGPGHMGSQGRGAGQY